MCDGLACDALGLCSPHRNRYRYDGSPGGGKLPGSVFRDFEAKGLPVPVTFVDRQAFTAWCVAAQTFIGPGQLDLRGLPPLVAAEIRWGLIAHARRPNRAVWRIRYLREVIALARRGGVASVFDDDIPDGSRPAALVLRGIRRELQLVYLTPADTKEAGFVCFEHFGVNVARRGNVYDLTSVTQRWLRDLLWEEIVELLQCASPPRSGSPLDYRRRALVELSAFLEATRADGGHEPSALHRDDMLRFVADQCLGRYGGVPMLWHDQTKVGHLDAAIRIPETVYQALRQRQDKTLAGFEERGEACPWQLNCEGCDKFVLSGADLLYWRRKREQWRSLAERAPDDAAADWLHQVFEPTARAIDGLEKALAELGLLEQAMALDYRRPQDYFHRIWSTAFRATELAQTAGHQPSDAEQE